MLEQGIEIILYSGKMFGREQALKSAVDNLTREGKHVINIIELGSYGIVAVIWRKPDSTMISDSRNNSSTQPTINNANSTNDYTNQIDKIISRLEVIENSIMEEKAAPAHTPIILKDNLQAALIRGKMYLEDKEWKTAADYFNGVLDIDPTCSDAYCGLFMAENKISNVEKITEVNNFYKNILIQRALKYDHYVADDLYVVFKENGYNIAKELISKGKFEKAQVLLTPFNDNKEGNDVLFEPMELAYQKAKDLIAKNKYYEARSILFSLGNYKDCKEIIAKFG